MMLKKFIPVPDVESIATKSAILNSFSLQIRTPAVQIELSLVQGVGYALFAKLG